MPGGDTPGSGYAKQTDPGRVADDPLGVNMASTHASLFYHIVFSTKNRRPILEKNLRDRLHAYMGGCLHTLNAFPKAIGGVKDHVHLLVQLRPTQNPSDVVRELKKHSTTWVHEETGSRAFAWQAGYSVFTVSPTSIDAIVKYIHEQEEHHYNKSFMEELQQMLDKAGVPYDPTYL